MKNRIIFLAFAALMALSGCRPNKPATFDWENNDKIEYTVDYTVSFSADHDSGPERDANYIYGPSLPRTLLFGAKLSI